MDILQKLAIDSECTALTLRFFRALDERDHAVCADLMAPDGVWERQGVLLRGGASVMHALELRAPGRRTCHVITNVIAAVQDAEHCRVQFYLVAYEGADGQDGKPGVARLAGIRSCTDEMELTGKGWKIAHKSSSPLFTGPPASAP